jgi:PAS domain S-box-containing protein
MEKKMTPDMVLSGSYDYGLVALSILIGLLGAYATIDLAARVKASHGSTRLSWRICGAVAMAIGTWAMHYTGMLAFRLPVPILYDWPISLLSFLPSLVASAVALIVVIRPKMESPRAFVASVFIGGGIGSLHYTAMASMRMQAMHHYSPSLVTLSVLLAMVFSLLSIWLTFLFRDAPRGWKLRKVASVALMGAAIWVMHYTGMASASYTESVIVPDLSHAVRISFLGAFGIGAVALTVLSVALATSMVDRLQKQKVLLDELFEQAPEAVTLMSSDYSVIRVNREFTKLFGYGPQEAIGRHLRELIVPEELQGEVEKFMGMLARRQRVEAEAVRRCKDGRRLNVSIVHVPVSLPGGEVATYAIYRDISERKKAEEKITVASARLRALSARLESAREEEGTRIAREIHDELGSALTSLRWDLETLETTLADSTSGSQLQESREKIEAMIKLTSDVLQTVRRISSELRPQVLDDLGLAEAVEWQAAEFQARTGIICNCDCSLEKLNLNQAQATAVFRILQEALTNVLRHAQATRVDIEIEEKIGEFVMTIVDNGKGITEAEQSADESLGLLGMRERADLIGGTVEIKGIEGSGTTITITINTSG